MAITKLPVNFKDDVIDTSVSDKRRYNLITNSDGTTSLEDVTMYEQIGSDFGAEQVNQTNGKVNELIDDSVATKELIETLKTEIKDGTVIAKKAENADKLTTPRKINGVNFDGTKDVEIEDNTKVSKDNFFKLSNKQLLSFAENVCTILDERITKDSLADVYFTTDTILSAEKAVITVETYDGYVQLNAENAPEQAIKASIKIFV